MDKLEEFILGNRPEFDEPRHPEKGWKELEKEISHQQKDWLFLWRVAALLFFLSTAVLAVNKFSEREPIPTTSVSSDLIEDFFVQVIEAKREEYSALANGRDREDFFNDLAELDAGYESLKKSFGQLESEELLDAMLENLQLRIYVLNEQIEILKNGNGGDEQVYHSS